MSPNMRKKLERNIQYHAAMADYHQGEVDARAQKTPPQESPPESDNHRRRPTASASPPPPKQGDADEKLATTHTEVVKQLQALLDNEPVTPAIVTAAQNRPLQRNLSSDVKPSAGRFH